MASTATYGFPSPEATAAPQGPAAIKALADAVDAQLKTWFGDSGWVDLTPTNPGFVPMAGSERPQARKIGNRVYLRGGWLTGTGNGIVNSNFTYNPWPAGAFPAMFTPPANTISIMCGSAGNSTANLHINADGSVSIRTGTVSAYYKMDRQVYLLD